MAPASLSIGMITDLPTVLFGFTPERYHLGHI